MEVLTRHRQNLILAHVINNRPVSYALLIGFEFASTISGFEQFVVILSNRQEVY